MEAILEIQKNKVWARLHLCPVRIGSDRHILVLIEDLTKEKMQLELSRRQEKESARQLGEMARQLQASNSELASVTRRLGLESFYHSSFQQALRIEKQKFEILWDKSPLACALVSTSGDFLKINPYFSEIFGCGLEDIPNLRNWILETWSDATTGQWKAAEWLNALNRSNEKQMASATVAAVCKDGIVREMSFFGVKLDDAHYFIICLCMCSRQEQGDTPPD